MKNIPKKIYLQVGDLTDDEIKNSDFNELSEVTWCKEKVSATDIEYVRSDSGEQQKSGATIAVVAETDLPIIDWEQRRYELTKAAMQGMIANSRYLETAYNKAGNEKVEVEFIVAFNAARYADAVIAKLKEE